ncbi:MAG: hypothetical protein H7841_14370 [Magnetospirillum sp. WYHS-4]
MTEFEALLLGVSIEAPAAYAVARRFGWACRGARHVGLASAVATAATHPQLWSGASWAYQHFPFWASALGAEALVTIAEALLISWMARLAIRPAFLVSVLANAASCAVGLTVIN